MGGERLETGGEQDVQSCRLDLWASAAWMARSATDAGGRIRYALSARMTLLILIQSCKIIANMEL